MREFRNTAAVLQAVGQELLDRLMAVELHNLAKLLTPGLDPGRGHLADLLQMELPVGHLEIGLDEIRHKLFKSSCENARQRRCEGVSQLNVRPKLLGKLLQVEGRICRFSENRGLLDQGFGNLVLEGLNRLHCIVIHLKACGLQLIGEVIIGLSDVSVDRFNQGRTARAHISHPPRVPAYGGKIESL